MPRRLAERFLSMLPLRIIESPFPPMEFRMQLTSGLTYTWDATLPVGSRVVEVRKGGQPIDRAANFTVTVNNFIAAGGDNFTTLLNGAGQVDGPIDLDALVAYVESLEQPFSATIEGRITRLH